MSMGGIPLNSLGLSNHFGFHDSANTIQTDFSWRRHDFRLSSSERDWKNFNCRTSHKSGCLNTAVSYFPACTKQLLTDFFNRSTFKRLPCSFQSYSIRNLGWFQNFQLGQEDLGFGIRGEPDIDSDFLHSDLLLMKNIIRRTDIYI